jgi:hypothetical protein
MRKFLKYGLQNSIVEYNTKLDNTFDSELEDLKTSNNHDKLSKLLYDL